ncbi:MAG: helix-turn-helix domain-containing protein [Anaerolineae bacterium]|nr:helix-turn-helix domain-containing protein [Anaerolineae bacterium]
MNRKEFGKLLAALRKSEHDEHFRQLTQRQLACLTGISEQALGNIERGDKVSLEPELLLSLARALRLSTRERHEFYLAAIGVNEEDMPARLPAASQRMDELFDSLCLIALPAFIVDSYDDIVAANNIILNLFEFSEKLREIAPNIIGGYNLLRFVFSERSQFNSILGKGHDKYLMQSIRFFRAISLPYRASPYYEYLLSAFRKDHDMGLFRHYYTRDNSESEQDDYYFENERFTLEHASFGNLDFYSPSVAPISTGQGNLYLIMHVPASALTVQACALLAQKYSPGALRLAPWPEKEMPGE